jgi:lipid II:glycine glycyltransferase (peptidoglycan interpeptide bridge formation enzyme)
VKVKEIDKTRLDKYKKFVSEEGSVFNTWEWKEKVHGENLKMFGIFEDDGQLAGIFHLYRKKYLWMSFIKNPPYIPNTGLIYLNKSANPSSVLSVQKKITEQVVGQINALSPDVVSIAFPPEIADMQVFFWQKFKVVPNYTYRIDLAPTVEEIEKGFSAEHRNSMKKAIKDQVEVKACSDYRIVKDLILETFRRKKESADEKLIDNILFKLADSENSFAYVSMFNNKPIAASFCLRDKNASYYLLGGYSADTKHQGAGILCIYNSIVHSRELGLKFFDFEGSMIKEVERYFRGFGPELVPYYTVNKARLPFEIILKFIKRQLF